MKERMSTLVRQPYFWGIVAIVALLAVNLAKDPTYLDISVNDHNGNLAGNLIDIMRAAAPILLIAAGMSLVIATGGIDLSVGSVMAVSGAVSMEYLHGLGADAGLGAAGKAVLLSLAIGLVLGLINGILVAFVGLQPFISTLVMMLAGRGLAKVITDGQNTVADNSQFRWISNGYVFGLPVVFFIALTLVLVVGLVIRRTALGLLIESIGINLRAARMAGIKPRGLLLTVYATSGLLASISGIFATASVMRVDVSRTGYQLELDAILAVVIGGTSLAGGKFSIRGAAVGALLIATLNKTVVFLGVPASATPAFKAVVIIALCLLQSQQIRGWLERRKVHAGLGAGPPHEHGASEAANQDALRESAPVPEKSVIV